MFAEDSKAPEFIVRHIHFEKSSISNESGNNKRIFFVAFCLRVVIQFF